MTCDLLIVGGTGLAGQALGAAARARGLDVLSLARRGEVAVDIRDVDELRAALTATPARIIINAAAIVSLAACERDPAAAWMVNTRPVIELVEHARSTGARLIQISTDHYYSGDGRKAHTEADPTQIINEYSRTKLAAEAIADSAQGALILRTNFVGWPSATGGSLAEWALDVIENDRPADLYADQFVSSLDVWSFAEAVLDLAASPAAGVLNLAASEVFSKAEFVERLAGALGRELSAARRVSVKDGSTLRGDSLGLDVSRAEAQLGRSLPTLDQVIANLNARCQQR